MFGGVEYRDYPDPENVRKLDMGALPMIHEFHRNGIRVDLPYLRAFTQELITSQKEIEARVAGELGEYQDFNPTTKKYTQFKISSPDYVARLFFQHLQIQGKDAVPLTPGGKRFSTSADVLGLYKDRHPVAKAVGEWREINKLRTTYTEPLQLLADLDSRIHTRFNATVAATGRLSSSEPNLQNIPVRTDLGKRVRRAFIAGSGRKLVSNDLSQIEMRWAAHRSQDPVMVEAFRLGQDIHTRTACIVFSRDYDAVMEISKAVDDKTATQEQAAWWKKFKHDERLPCKTTGFGVLYGQTAEGLHDSLLTDGVDWAVGLCQDFIDNKFFGVYGGLLRMLERDYAYAYRYGLTCDPFGRARLVPEAKSFHKRISNEGVRKAGNHPEQSGAQGTIKLGMAELTPICRGLGVLPLLQIHDELIMECEDGIAVEYGDLAREVLKRATPLTISVLSSFNVGETWADL